MTDNNRIKFAYLQDPKNPNRVVTIARARANHMAVQWPHDEILFSVAINRCSGKKAVDRHSKKIGRNVSTGRLLACQYDSCSSSDELSDHLSILKYLAENNGNKNKTLRRIASFHYHNR